MAASQEATRFLIDLGHGNRAAAEQLMPLVYEELRALAGSYFRGRRADHTLQPTALVHEAFVRLIDQSSPAWKDRAHFFAVAATAMRQILVDHARRSSADKRGGDWQQVSLGDADQPTVADPLDALALDDALARLADLDPRQHRIVELRFFAGLTMEEIAEVLQLSKATVELDWRAARAWLNVQLK